MGNLVHHAKTCTGIASTGFGSIAAFVHGSTYTSHKFRMKIALWVACRHRPFTIVKDDELIKNIHGQTTKLKFPHGLLYHEM
jgi:hypothetical protein